MFRLFAHPRRSAGCQRVTGLGLDMVLEDRLAPALFTGRTWTITGQDSDGTSWSGSTLIFTQETSVTSGLQLEGFFDWVSDTGASGRELFNGSYTTAGRALDMTGFDLVNPVGIVTGHYTADLDVTGNAIINGLWDTNITGTWSATAPPLPNTPPVISDVPDQPAVVVGTAVGPVAFTVGDAETAAGSLTVTATTSNAALLPPGTIVFGGSGANRTVTLNPTGGPGTADVTVTVTDAGGLSVSDTFRITVVAANTPPVISDVPDQPAVVAGTVVGPVAFTVGDAETAAGSLTVTAATSNAILVPTGNIAIGGSGANRIVTVTPTADQTGTATITLTVSDASGGTATDTFTVTFTPPVLPLTARPAAVGGPLDGSARVLTPSGGPYTLGGTPSFFPGQPVNVRTATADVTGDGVPDFIGGTGPGAVTRVSVRDGATGQEVVSWQPFESAFTGGVFIAALDMDGDGKAEVVVSPDQGGGPVAAVFAGSKLAAGTGGDAAQIVRFFGIDDPAFRGGARPALGDVTGDSKADLIVSAGFLGGPRITIWDGASVLAGTPAQRLNFFAFEDTPRSAAFVAAGDMTGDGIAEVAFGGGPGGAPRVRLFDGAALLAAGPFTNLDEVGSAQKANFFAGDSDLRGGVRLALRDADGDGEADLVTGSGEGEPSRVRVYRAANLLANPSPAADQELDPFGAVLADGVFVG